MKKPKRRYVLQVRGERVAETRARIIEAVVQLHGEVGPRHTTVSAIAARAGVQRLTVYRHFQDDAAPPETQLPDAGHKSKLKR